MTYDWVDADALRAIDVEFDLRIGATTHDPDVSSEILRRYHRTLWSKPLPSGEVLTLTNGNNQGKQLRHDSMRGSFTFSSDIGIPTYMPNPDTPWAKMQQFVEPSNDRLKEEFRSARYTIGAIVLFPVRPPIGAQTINQSRGRNTTISDRLDLTLECIRCYYEGIVSPLGKACEAYRWFFDLFESFRGYIDFFLLQDMVADDYGSIRLSLPSRPSGPPRSVEEYETYATNSIAFIRARNQRIQQYVNATITAATG